MRTRRFVAVAALLAAVGDGELGEDDDVGVVTLAPIDDDVAWPEAVPGDVVARRLLFIQARRGV